MKSDAENNTQTLLQAAITLQINGNLNDAEPLYRSILHKQPDHADALHNLGLIYLHNQHISDGLLHLKQALVADMQRSDFWLSYLQALLVIGDRVQARQMLALGKQLVGLQSEDVNKIDQQLSTPSDNELKTLIDCFNNQHWQQATTLAHPFISLYPLMGLGWKVLGIAQLRLGQVTPAQQTLQHAITLLPNDIEAHIHYAEVLLSLGQYSACVDSYLNVLKLNPYHIATYENLGALFHDLGHYQQAETCFNNALILAPDNVKIMINLGLNLQMQNKAIAAESHFRQAIQQEPNNAKYHYYLSTVLKMQNRLAEANVSCQQALSLNPDYPEAYNQLGSIAFDLGLFDEAEHCFTNAITQKPDYADAYNNLGTLHQVQRHIVSAGNFYRQALQLNPHFALAYTNLGINLQSQGQVEQAENCWRTSLSLNPNQIDTQSGLLFNLNYTVSPSSNYIFEAKKFGAMVASIAETYEKWECDPQPSKLRVGLVSGDFRNHPVGHFLHSLLKHISNYDIELVAYATQPGTDHFSELIKPYFTEWRNIGGLTDTAAARLIYTDKLHVLFDLSGHSSYNRLALFAWKAAPIQVSWLGYLASTGVTAIDYILSDHYAIRTEDEQNFSEKILRLPQCCVCFTPTFDALLTTPLPALSTGHITFGSFNNLAKMNNQVVALWAKLLTLVPNAKLCLKASQLQEPQIQNLTLQRFAEHGISAERLILLTPIPNAKEHLLAYQNIDIALDTFPYPGVTTSVEALAMGVPVLTLQGNGLLARMGESINHNANLPDWIAVDEADYLSKAIYFSKNLAQLAQLRLSLTTSIMSSPLFDSASFAKHFSDSLWALWQDRH